MRFGSRRPRVLAFSCSRATPRSKRQYRNTKSTPRKSVTRRLQVSASRRLHRRKVPKPGERYRRLAPRGILELVVRCEGKCSRGLQPVGALGALRSGAPSTSALTLPSKGRPTAGHTASLRHGQPRRWPPLMSNVRAQPDASREHPLSARRRVRHHHASQTDGCTPE